MKKQCLLLVCVVAAVITRAQTIEITTNHTTSLIFPFAISHVDRGTQAILAQPLKETDNILMLKAASKEFDPTNISVVTTDGSIYSFPVIYSAKPSEMVYPIAPKEHASIETYANGILDNPRTMWGMEDRSWNISGSVTGIYIKRNLIYYQIRISNNSAIDYDIDLLRFYIKDKKKNKRTATQEQELKPLFVAGNTRQVRANTKNYLVVALDKFTIPDAKFLGIDVQERNGGRHLSLKVGNNKIIRAITLPDLK